MSMLKHLFAYGSLMCEDIMAAVAQCRPTSVPATLDGHRRFRLRGEHYPALLAQAGAQVLGRLYLNLPAAAWERLDRFEGEHYLRQPVQVVLADASARSAQAYLSQSGLLDRIEPLAWDFEQFLRQGRAAFESSYPGYRALAVDSDQQHRDHHDDRA